MESFSDNNRYTFGEVQRTISHILPATLDSVEVRRFVDMFSQIAPSKRAKLQEVATTTETKQKTAFYFGLTAFGRDFRGLSSYVNNRINEVEPSAKRMLVYLSLVHHYAQRAIPVDLFAKLVGTHPVRLDVALPTGSLELLLEEKHGHWRTIHELIALEIIEQLLAPAGSDRRLWKQLVSQRAIEFMELCSASDGPVGEEPLEILRRMFVYRDSSNIIGSEVAAINKFSHLLEDIPARDGRLRVLQELVRQCPEEPHFLAHLGRFYSIEMRDPIRALECLDKAIALQPTDHLLHHMKGMVFRKEMEQLIMEKEKLEAVTLSAKAARESFERARVLEPDDEHGYISEVQVIAKLMDYAGRSSQRGSFSYLKGESVDPAMRELLEKAEDLLEQVRRNREGDRASLFEVECRAKLDALYGDHERALQAWDGLLAQPGAYRPPLRRQIIRTYLARHERTWSKLSPKEVKRSLQLLNDNLEEDPYNDRDLRLWLQAARYAPAPLPIETAIERVAYWKTKSGALDAVYYLYVLHTILALEGSKLHRDEAELFMAECRQIARGRRNRTKSFEWVGKGAGPLALVHQAELGEWREDLDFWSSTERLKRLDGRISKIEAPQSGEIELDGGVFAFFVPAGRVGRGEFSKGRHENAAISCFVGFSYDGLRAWDVRSREKPA
ncbi:MAG TPA: hypothetical protein VOA80_14060 [Thermoanaerobaculia bacterium]|nr:hypothetical protein [Thermoanaerobaculia bacterium]